jgi:hypothetical protein
VAYSIPTTALNVLCRDPDSGASAEDFYHSKVYDPGAAVEALRRRGYRIASRMEVGPEGGKPVPRYFIKMEQVRKNALKRRKPSREQVSRVNRP